MRNMMKTIPALFGGLLCLLGIPASWAEETRYYDIEVIIFESKDLYSRQSEVWKTDVQRETPKTYIELGQPYPGPLPAAFVSRHTFKPLASNSYHLAQAVKLLKASDRYNILYHKAWRQPGMDAETALPVHIKLSFTEESTLPGQAPAYDPNRPATSQPVPGYTQQTRAELDGYIRIILSRYLHAEVDLVYTTGLPVSTPYTSYPAGSLQQDVAPPVVYRLQESRRMRSTEVHYLDHPVLGMIILATPFEAR